MVLEKNRKEPELIDSKELVGLLESASFQTLVFKQAKKVRRSQEGFELGFDVLRKSGGGKYIYLEKMAVIPGGVGRGDNNYYETLREGQHFLFVDVHFHPGIVGIIFGNKQGVFDSLDYSPSSDDLIDLMNQVSEVKDCGFMVKPIMILAIPEAKDRILMLLVQPTPFAIVDNRFDIEYGRDRHTWKTKDEVIDSLLQYGFKAAYISYSKSGLSSEDKQKMTQFSFDVKRIPVEFDLD